MRRNILKERFIPRGIGFGQRNDRVNRAIYRKLRCKIGVVRVSGFHCRSDFTFKCGYRHRERKAPEHRLAGVRKQEVQKGCRAVCVIGIFEDRDLCIRTDFRSVRTWPAYPRKRLTDRIAFRAVHLPDITQNDRLCQRQITPDQKHGVFYFKPQLLRFVQRGGIVQQRPEFLRVKAARFRFFIQECVEKILFHIEKEQLAAHAGEHENVRRVSQIKKLLHRPVLAVSEL